jgi:hypothetical protein
MDMNRDKISAALDTKFDSMDLGEVTARQYLKRLLNDLLMKGECFSGKRPFGNSGWEHDLAKPLILAGVIEGSIEDGYAEPAVDDEYTEALKALVEAL